MKEGVRPADIFCNGNQTATATGKGGNGASQTSGSGGSRPSTGAARGMYGEVGVSKMGLGVLGFVVVSMFAGAMV
jgi:hypothetical protein